MSSDQLAASRKRSARPRWHQLYYLLAVFDLVTVVLSLTLNHQTREVFTHSVAVNQAWRQRLADYSDLGALIAAVNAPGNDVFDSHDAAYESERMRVAQAAYEEHFVVLREEVRANASPAEAARVLAAFDGVAAAMADMTSQAEQIFSLYAQGEPEQAARRMATMDRKYATVLTAQAHLRREVAAIQQETLAQQAATADLLAKFEIVIAGTIILMVTRAVVYGHKLFKRMEADQRERDRLSEQLADREQRLQELVHRLLVAQEEERRRVAHEVHDGVAQMAAAVQLHFEAFAERVRPRSPAARQELAQLLELSQQTVREARRVIAGLRPTVLDDFGLAAAIGQEVEALRGDGWPIQYDEALGLHRVPAEVETALYRVAQEALRNVRKHAGHSRVEVSLRRQAEWVRLQVRDWGRGFTPNGHLGGTGPGEHVGIPGMQERVALVGGRCLVSSQVGAGTHVLVEVPVANGR